MTVLAIVPLTTKQKRFLLFVKLLNEYAIKYTSVPIMIHREPLDTNLVDVILSDNQYTIDNRAYLTNISEGFREFLKYNKSINKLWEEYSSMCKMHSATYVADELMNPPTTAAKVLMEEKLRSYFLNI